MKRFISIIICISILLIPLKVVSVAGDDSSFIISEVIENTCIVDYKDEKSEIKTIAKKSFNQQNEACSIDYTCYQFLDDAQKIIYDTIVDNPGKLEITISFDKGVMLYSNFNIEYFNVVMNALCIDRPDLFYFNGYSINKGYLYDSTYVKSFDLVINTFDSSGDKEHNLSEYFNALMTKLSQVPVDTTNRYNFIKSVHDYLANTVYFPDLNSSDFTRSAYSAYGAIVEGRAVSQGYSNAVKLICDYYNIPCVCISGTANGGSHMWNAIQMEDGLWYLMDVTWDDQVNKIYYDFFLVGTESTNTYFGGKKFSEEHIPDSVINMPNLNYATDKYQTISYKYNDSYFNNPATNYNHELATTSCYLALSTFQSAEQGITHTDAVSLLKGCGFDSESIKLYNYYSNTNPDDIGCIIAQKKINDETLIAVAVRGGDYGKEWASNFTIGTSGDHQGFDEASDIVLSRIKGYIENQSISGKVKFWLTGFSRAAATATQTAAKLNFTYIENVEFTKNDVYAYGFATPAGAIKDSDPTNLSKYGNIFHIINFHDIVPRVAPKLWGFGRYGKTYYLPFSENSWGSAVEKEQDVIDWFEYNGLDYKVDEFVATYSDSAFSYIPKSNDTLGVFCEKLVNDIAILINSRSSYVEKLQNSIRETVIEENLSVSNKTVEKLLDVLVAGILLKPQYISTILSSPLMLIEAHAAYGAYYLGWMEEIPVDRALDYLNNGDTRHWLFNCPVDVYVYDKLGTLVAAIENDLPVEIEDTPFSYGVDANGQKYFCLPVDNEYDIKVIAREDCETTCTVNEFSNGSLTESRVATFTEIPMVKDEALLVSTSSYSEDDIVNGTEDGSSAEYTIQREDGQVLDVDIDVAGQEIENYTYNVTVEYDENKGIVYGGGEFTIGQFCQVNAKNKPGYKFSRWVVNGETVSIDYSYRFAVKENVTIVAEYEVCEHANFTPELVSPTCTEDGYTKHTCDVCTYSYNDSFVDATGHTYQWCEKIETTTTEAGVLEYKCIVCERVLGLEKTLVLSGFSFVATDMESYSVTSYNGIITDIKIPVTNNNCQVTAIGNDCFMDNSNITRVVIPIGIKEIGSQAFMNCTALEVVSIPTTVTSIGVEAFYGFNGTIICQKDSYAHQYAEEHGIAYSFPTLEASDSKTFIDFDKQYVISTITRCKNIEDFIKIPSTILTLPFPSLKSNNGEFYGTGSTITMFDGNTFMGDYVLIITGDTNGDSVCDALDAAQVALVSNGHQSIDGAYKMAADSNSDDIVDIDDYQAIVNKVVA